MEAFEGFSSQWPSAFYRGWFFSSVVYMCHQPSFLDTCWMNDIQGAPRGGGQDGGARQKQLMFTDCLLDARRC